jgi:hypothetical protein
MTDNPFLHSVVLEAIEPQSRSLWRTLAHVTGLFGSVVALLALAVILG